MGVMSFEVYVSDVIGRRFEKVKNDQIFENWTPIWGLDVDLSLTYLSLASQVAPALNIVLHLQCCILKDILIDKESMSAVNVEENKVDVVIGHLSAIDEDVSDVHTYSITDPSGLFVVEGNILKVCSHRLHIIIFQKEKI